MRKIMVVFFMLVICIFAGCNKPATDTPLDSSNTTTSISNINSHPSSDLALQPMRVNIHLVFIQRNFRLRGHKLCSYKHPNAKLWRYKHREWSHLHQRTTPLMIIPHCSRRFKSGVDFVLRAEFQGKTEQQFKAAIDNMFDQIKDIGLNAVICCGPMPILIIHLNISPEC